MEKIAMKCTRAEYESIKELVGELVLKSEDDFIKFKYLSTRAGKSCAMYNGCTMYSIEDLDKDRKVYETFDKDVFLKACGIETSNVEINLLDVEEALGKDTIVAINTRVKKDKRTKMFKKTIKLLKSLYVNTVDIEYGYDIDYEGNKFLDGTFEITITGNKTK